MADYDVIVLGGGNAAMCAAIAARHVVSRVLVLERAPEHMRGGNTRHTRNIRCSHLSADQFFSGPYTEEELLQDLIGVTGGPAKMDLAKFAIRQSSKLPQWMSEHGVNWQQPLAGTLHLGRTNRWFLGGGKALLNTYYRTAGRMGVDVRYDAFVGDLIIENNRFEAVSLKKAGPPELVRGRAVVVATGGYEANIEWLKRSWGAAADNFLVRGTPYNDGTVLAALLKRNAKPIGDPKGFHAIAIDARSPKFDGGIVTRLDAIPFGIVVNKQARRFYDEGEDIWPKRYAIWGGLIAGQPDQLVYCIVDSKTVNRFLPPLFKPYQSDSLEGLAAILNLDPKVFRQTLEDYNLATAGNTQLRIETLDRNATHGLTPPKSNWALPIDRPPFYGLPLRPGITFTYMGVEVDETGRVIDQSGKPFENVYAAGEIMSGNILTKGYLGGFGLTIGSVFGELGEGWRRRMPELNLFEEANRQLVICNACRYCEGFCPVFRAIETRRDFAQGDVLYLANLCHDCRACYYSCMFTPPHEFAVNIPQILSEARIASYQRWSWPDLLARAFKDRRVGLSLALVVVALIAVLALVLIPPDRLFAAHQGPGAFYEVVPYLAMVIPAIALFFYGIILWLRGSIRSWSETGGTPQGPQEFRAIIRALGAALGVRYLQGGGPGCYYPGESPSVIRRVYHNLVVWGFLSDFASTNLAFIYQDFLHLLPPYSLTSAPVVFGAVGGVALLIGTAGLISIKLKSDRTPAADGAYGMDYLFLVILCLTALSGLLTLALRATPALGSLLVLHLAFVAALFITAPYGKFVHGIYRTEALVRYYAEQESQQSAHH